MEIVVLLVIILIGLIPATIAKRKGRKLVRWWIYGSLLFVVALVHALLIESDQAAIEKKQMAEGMLKKCLSCAEMIKSDAKICRYCGQK